MSARPHRMSVSFVPLTARRLQGIVESANVCGVTGVLVLHFFQFYFLVYAYYSSFTSSIVIMGLAGVSCMVPGAEFTTLFAALCLDILHGSPIHHIIPYFNGMID